MSWAAFAQGSAEPLRTARKVQLVDLATGHHVPGALQRYKHGWIPVAPGTDQGESASLITEVKAPPRGTVSAAVLKASRAFETQSQEDAESWYDDQGGNNLDKGLWRSSGSGLEDRALSFWDAYQNPDDYGPINKILRGPDGPDRKKVMQGIDRMWQDAGETVKPNVHLFRAIRGDDPSSDKFLEAMQPGAVYQEKGMISASGELDSVQGWLKLVPKVGDFRTNRPIHPDDTVIEIKPLPTTKVVGGATQFIEVMMHPDTKFRVVSVDRRIAKAPQDPLGDSLLERFEYRHVVVEVVP